MKRKSGSSVKRAVEIPVPGEVEALPGHFEDAYRDLTTFSNQKDNGKLREAVLRAIKSIRRPNDLFRVLHYIKGFTFDMPREIRISQHNKSKTITVMVRTLDPEIDTEMTSALKKILSADNFPRKNELRDFTHSVIDRLPKESETRKQAWRKVNELNRQPGSPRPESHKVDGPRTHFTFKSQRPLA